ncbi:MAG: hypothetical protein IJ543_01305 [Bacteroidales bacterium]|nr:hypothetical protein [Bacteroidales bacterium]
MKIELFSNEDFAKAFPLAAGAWGEFYADERHWFINAVADTSSAITTAIPRWH